MKRFHSFASATFLLAALVVIHVPSTQARHLYRQGREIAHLWTGTLDGYRINLPFT